MGRRQTSFLAAGISLLERSTPQLWALQSPKTYPCEEVGVVKIAAAQMELVPDIETNTRRIKEFIEQAAVFGVDIMAFPRLP